MKAVAMAMMLAMAGMVGCSSTPLQTDSQRLAQHRSHAGDPVSSFRMTGGIRGWHNLGDSALVVFTGPSDAWLLELDYSCPGLSFSPNIGLTSQMDRVQARFDKVIVRDGGMIQQCRISTIRPVDMKALKQENAEMRKATLEERSEGGDSTGSSL